MNLTWHLVRKDLRQFRWPIVGWTGLIGAKLLIGFILLSSGIVDLRAFEWLGLLAQGLSALEYSGLVLVIMVVQADPLTGSNAFWLGRPISGARLLRAKLLVLGVVFLVLPVLLTLPWWLWCGYGPTLIAWAAIETALPHLAVLLVGLAAGLLTSSLLQSLAAMLGAAVVLGILGGFIEYHSQSPEPASRLVLGCAIAVASLALVCWLQFNSRRTRRSLALVAATLCILATVSHWGPRSGQADQALERSSRAIHTLLPNREPGGLRFKFVEAFVDPILQFNDRRRVEIVLDVEGLKEEEGLDSLWTEFSWRWPDGTCVYNNGTATSISARKRWRIVKPTSAGSGGPKDRIVARVDVSAALAESILATRAECTLRLGLALERFDYWRIHPNTDSSVASNGFSSRLRWIPRPSNKQPTFLDVATAPQLDLRAVLRRRSEIRFPYEVSGGFRILRKGTRLSSWDGQATRIGTVLVACQPYRFSPGEPDSSSQTEEDDKGLFRLSSIVQAEFYHSERIRSFRRGSVRPDH